VDYTGFEAVVMNLDTTPSGREFSGQRRSDDPQQLRLRRTVAEGRRICETSCDGDDLDLAWLFYASGEISDPAGSPPRPMQLSLCRRGSIRSDRAALHCFTAQLKRARVGAARLGINANVASVFGFARRATSAPPNE
jgi:hypothetical protein